mmetsp:Transcript_10150/g.29167  ORF Transcript_10150/g.29167 Transcript_10150/m.29167 type:complete len:887 (-) Transcript_10150:1367-4027(-)
MGEEPVVPLGEKRDRSEEKLHKEKKEKSHHKEKRHKHEKKEKRHKEKSQHKDKSKSKDKDKERAKEVPEEEDPEKIVAMAGDYAAIKEKKPLEANGSAEAEVTLPEEESETPKLPVHGQDDVGERNGERGTIAQVQPNGEGSGKPGAESPEPGEIQGTEQPVETGAASPQPSGGSKGGKKRDSARSHSPRRGRDEDSRGRRRDNGRGRDSGRHRERDSEHSRHVHLSDRHGARRDYERGSSRGGGGSSSYREREFHRSSPGQKRSRSRSHSHRPGRRSRSPPRRRSPERSHRGGSRERRGDGRGIPGQYRQDEGREESPVVEEPEQDEDAIIEARRNRWKNIKQKYMAGGPDDTQPLAANRVRAAVPEKAPAPAPPAGGASPADVQGAPVAAEDIEMQSPEPNKREEQLEDLAGHNEDSAEDVQLGKDNGEEGGDATVASRSGRSAAGEPGAGDMFGNSPGNSPGILSGLEPKREERVKAPVSEKKGDAAADMFAEDDDDVGDMFAKTPVKKGTTAAPAHSTQGLLDNWDDADGYYKIKIGEVIGETYQVKASQGRGVFSSVVRAHDLSKQKDSGEYEEVAVKVIRSNETMYKAGQTEREILRIMSEEDRDGKRHCVRMLTSFEYRSHLCLVFESMAMNLRELVKKYGRDVGLNINAVRQYAEQLMIGLHHMHRCKVVHADIKPDNILVNDRHTIVKFCDFGSAMYDGDNDITPYLVSRFYRAPEIILGLPYGHPLDMWSVGCVLYELFTGKILFAGRTNNEMLKLMMTYKGAFPKKMLRKGAFASNHFEGETLDDFCLLEEDPVTKQPIRRHLKTSKIQTKTFAEVLSASGGDKKKAAALADLLDKCLALDPDRRITAKQALAHPFIASRAAAPPPAASAAAKRK